MKVIKTATRLAILLAFAVSSVAVISTGATISAFAQQSAIDLELPNLPQLPEIPDIPNEEDFIPCLPPPECLLPGSEVCVQVCWPFPEASTE